MSWSDNNADDEFTVSVSEAEEGSGRGGFLQKFPGPSLSGHNNQLHIRFDSGAGYYK